MQGFTTEAYETHSQWKCHQRRKFWIKLSPSSFWWLIESNAILYPRRVNTRKRKAEEKKCVKCNIYTFQWVFIIKAHDMMKDYKKLPIAQRSQSIKSQIFLVCPKGRLGICRDRRDRRSCKIFVSCVNFFRKQRSFLLILQVYTHLNVNFLHNC